MGIWLIFEKRIKANVSICISESLQNTIAAMNLYCRKNDAKNIGQVFAHEQLQTHLLMDFFVLLKLYNGFFD